MTLPPVLPRLILVTNRRLARMPIPTLAMRAADGGVDALHIREKDMADDVYERLVECVIEAAPPHLRIVVNGRPEIAKRCGADIHFPERVEPAPTADGADARLRSRSVHSPASAQTGFAVDYLLAGHLFPTSSKDGLPPLGQEGLRRIAAAAAVPVFAIGGITAANVAQAIGAGAYGVAVMSAINDAERPELAAIAIRKSLEEAMNEHPMTATPGVTVTINGGVVELSFATTVQQFLELRNLRDRLVVVEINKTIVPRGTFLTRVLESGDSVEIVHFVGGG